MKVVCTIGSQGFSDGRRFVRGDVYEVDDETASTLILNGYVKEYVKVEEVVAAEVVTEIVDDEDVPKIPPTSKKTKKSRR